MSALHSKVSILQHNTARTDVYMHSCLQTALEFSIDFVLIQEPYITKYNTTVSHPAYYCILSSIINNIRPRVAIYARKQSSYSYCHRTDLTESSDIIIINVSGSNIETFQIINIYNEKSLDSESDSTDYTVERSLQHI